MTLDRHKPILINGAGIAGLTAALALAESGFKVVVYERAERFETLGAGIQLSPNATRVLADLGLSKTMGSIASEPDSIELNVAFSGESLTRIPLGQRIREKFGAPYLVAHRADFHSVLLNRCQSHPQIKLFMEGEVLDFTAHPRGVTVLYSLNGQIDERPASALVVADGVWSRLRTRVLGLPTPVYNGKVAWRALMSADQFDARKWLQQTRVWFAARSHIVSYPVRSGKMLNLVIITDGPDNDSSSQLTEGFSTIRTRFRNAKGEFAPLLENNARWTGWPIFETPAPLCLTFGPVALIGDAAHAMSPFAAQGAAMAIEDAASLANSFATANRLEDALSGYASSRRSRVRKMMKLAERNGRVFHLDGMMEIARNTVLRLSPPGMLAARQNWIYDWRA